MAASRSLSAHPCAHTNTCAHTQTHVHTRTHTQCGDGCFNEHHDIYWQLEHQQACPLGLSWATVIPITHWTRDITNAYLHPLRSWVHVQHCTFRPGFSEVLLCGRRETAETGMKPLVCLSNTHLTWYLFHHRIRSSTKPCVSQTALRLSGPGKHSLPVANSEHLSLSQHRGGVQVPRD